MAKIELKRVTCWKGIAKAAAAIGISRAHLSRIMSGERRPGKATAEKMRSLGIKWPHAA